MNLPPIILAGGLLLSWGSSPAIALAEGSKFVQLEMTRLSENSNQQPSVMYSNSFSDANDKFHDHQGHKEPPILSQDNGKLPMIILKSTSPKNTSPKQVGKDARQARIRYFTLLAGAAISVGLFWLALFLQKRFPTPHHVSEKVSYHQSRVRHPASRQGKPFVPTRRKE